MTLMAGGIARHITAQLTSLQMMLRLMMRQEGHFGHFATQSGNVCMVLSIVMFLVVQVAFPLCIFSFEPTTLHD
jgi:hypothetical protein